MELLSCVRGTPNPIVIHCSAGIGRTGTIVAIEYILEKMVKGVIPLSMFEILKELRAQRAFTIQNDIQYLFVHRVILGYFLEKHGGKYFKEEYTERFKKFCEEYEQALLPGQ
ncbi:unnamed protein product [Caenorhabditis auriculariae]|uniref:Protein-tyrosine phosphatase n=1 Tax=Caenorhabditis auriculariae TaxID=2777116 RepID=A0A8S1HC81_9PELO|nr:unnamed protein product [Caenorhabditis auriculariae]